MTRRGAVAVLAAITLAASCGKKGVPLPPLNLVPGAPTDVTLSRIGGDAHLRFVLPARNQNGPGASVLHRVEIYAVTVAPGAVVPPNRELLTAKFLVGSIPVKPAAVEGEPAAADAAADTRPSPGDKATFVEPLTEEKLTPVLLPAVSPAAVQSTAAAAPAPDDAATATSPATAPAAAGQAATTATATATTATATAPAPAPPPSAQSAATAEAPPAPPAQTAVTPEAAPAPPAYPVRVYAVRGLAKNGRPGPPAARVQLPLVAPPPPPAAVTATFTESAIVLAWTPPDAITPAPSFNVYKADAADPINAEPVSGVQYDRAGVSFGTEECFAVRSVQKVAGVDIQSDPATVCVTPRDTFAPAAPKGLSVVAAPGTMSLSWDRNTESDLGGYLVLRGEAAGDTLQPLTPALVTGTSFEDRTATAGVRYAYAVVAVDQAEPPNRSPQSARVEETAR